MKQVSFVVLVISFFPSFLFAQVDRKIQNDPAATAILDQVSKKYNSYTSAKVDFSLLVDTPDEEAYMKSRGMVYLKNEKYKIDTEEMMIICDNVKRYVYLKESNELQINYFEPEADEIESPSELFQIYKKDYFYKLSGEVIIDNKKLSVITLIPNDIKASPYKLIKLYVDKSENQITKGEIFAKDGVKYTYGISSVEENIQLNDSEFSFDPARYPGIYVDDMTK
ncbi:MAG: outer membrane lipoprotein carrier protein LolA [Chitinophagales bacterium]|nr:outer membrane lipoprotein carrier protein LolA [Chitinophagales bacterium]